MVLLIFSLQHRMCRIRKAPIVVKSIFFSEHKDFQARRQQQTHQSMFAEHKLKCILVPPPIFSKTLFKIFSKFWVLSPQPFHLPPDAGRPWDPTSAPPPSLLILKSGLVFFYT